MKHKDDKLKFDLDFLGEGTLDEKEKKHKPKEGGVEPKKQKDQLPMSNETKWVLGAVCLALFAIILAASGGGSNSIITSDMPTSGTSTRYTPIESPTKTSDQICKDNYSINSYYTEKKDSKGGPICDCSNGYQWNTSRTTCVVAPKVKTSLEICQERNGYNVTYDSVKNSCECKSGYYLDNTSQQCVSLTVARNLNCAAQFPGTSFLKIDAVSGKDICDCVAGSYWNNERTACYTLTSFNQRCVSTFGTGSVSSTENGKIVCDCGYGYDFNPQRNACVTTASINAICEQDVGRNSRYAGTSSGGKYNCTEPY